MALQVSAQAQEGKSQDSLDPLWDKTFDLAKLPPPIPRYVQLRSMADGGKLLTGDALRYKVIVWLYEILRDELKQRMPGTKDFDQWLSVLIIWEGYLRPLHEWVRAHRGPPPPRSKDKNVQVARALCDPEKVREWVPADLVRKITEYASHVLLKSRRGKPVASSRFYELRTQGIKRLLDAIQDEIGNLQTRMPGTQPVSMHDAESEKDLDATPTYGLPELPPHIVRGTLGDLVNLVVERQAQKGGWVALIGLPGEGKTTLLRDLVQDERIRGIFPAGRLALVSASIDAERGTETGSRSLALQIAKQLDSHSPGKKSNPSRQSRPFQAHWHQALQEIVAGSPVLIVVDDVACAGALNYLRPLPEQVVVLVATRHVGVAEALEVPDNQRLLLGGFSEDETVKLATAIAGPASEQDLDAMQACIRTVEGHPLLVRNLAWRAKRHGWPAMRGVVSGRFSWRALSEGGVTQDVRIKRIVDFVADAWQELDPQLRACLAALGQLPLFQWYDLDVGRAVWNLPVAETLDVLDGLVNAGLLERDEEGLFHLHWLVWQSAREAQETQQVLQHRQVKQIRTAFQRYSLERAGVAWRWYWPSVQDPEEWWKSFNIVIPKTKLELRFTSTLPWLEKTGWQRAEGLMLEISEWALAKRRYATYLASVGSLAILTSIIAAADVISSVLTRGHGVLPFTQVLSLLIGVLAVFPTYMALVSYIDLMRIVRARALGCPAKLRRQPARHEERARPLDRTEQRP